MIKHRSDKKILIALLTVILCVAALACTGCGKKLKVTFSYGNGMSDSVVEVNKGETVAEPGVPTKEGFEFIGWKQNGADGYYVFSTPVTEDITLVAEWKEKGGQDNPDNPDETVRIRWQDESYAEFLFDGSIPRNVKKGTTVSFGLRVSPYYEGSPTVKAGNSVLTPDADGKYSFVAQSSVTVSVEGLTRADSVIKGMGTIKSPYKIANASQFKTFTDSINSGSDKYKEAYIELTSDIDFNGETLDPVADNVNLYFSGNFNGNGHTLSDFNINAENGYAGLFGYIVTATLENLNVKNDIVLETSSKLNYIAGGIVSYNIGSDIINCGFSGSYSVVNTINEENMALHLGGICGFMQSYAPDYTASISYCRVDGTLSSSGDYPLYNVGGIAGASFGASAAVAASVYNCSFNGEISGKIQNAGGIVGYLREKSSLANCYVSGKISALINQKESIAGAICGRADNETSATHCVSAAKLTCAFSSGTEGEKSEVCGLVFNDAQMGVDSRKAVVKNVYNAESGSFDQNGTSYDLKNLGKVCELAGWNKADWQTDNGKIVPLYDETAEQSIHARFIFGTEVTKSDKDGKPLTLTEDTVTANGVLPVYVVYDGTGMNTFTADNGRISYGYFFDKELTERVPSCYLLTNDVDIYVGFADYADVAGEYYLTIKASKSGEVRNIEIQLVFDDNGKMTMIYDGIVASYMYVYNGEKILIKDGYFAYIRYPDIDTKKYDLTADYYCDIVGDKLEIYDTVFFAKPDNAATANKLNKAMGNWYASDGSVYSFLSDGTGSITDANGNYSEFTYSCNGNSVTIKMGSESGSASISSDGKTMQSSKFDFTISKTDIYKGLWETGFANRKTIEFDGKGEVKYNGGTYSYEINGDAVSFGGITAAFNADGLLVVTDNGTETVYGREGSYIGVWKETLLNYTMVLYGIGKDGYGHGRDSNNVDFTYIAEKSYESKIGKDVISVTMYYRTRLYGMFNEVTSKQDKSTLLYMVGYYAETGMLVDDFNMCYEDPFKGTWNSSDGTQYVFNGLGEYNIDFALSDGRTWKAIGSVSVIENGVSTDVKYHYDRANTTASFTYNGKTYAVKLSGNDVLIDEKVCKSPDEVSLYKYHVGDDIIEFNGKSPVGLGKAKVTANGAVTEYDYSVTESENSITAIITDGSAELYKFVFETTNGVTKTTVSKNGEVVTGNVGLYHRAIGKKYLISDDMFFYSTENMDMTGTAKGMFADLEVEITYVDENYVRLRVDGTFLYFIYYVDENTLAIVDSSLKTIGVLTVPDGYQGVYVADDGSTVSFDGRSKSEYTYAYMTLTVIEDFDGEKEEIEYVYVYKEENGELFAYEVDRSGEDDVLVKKYKISGTKTDGAKAFKSETSVVYLSEISE